MSRIDPIPSNPFHIARAYQVQPPKAVRNVRPEAQAAEASPVGSIRPQGGESVSAGVQRVLAGVVPGRVNFTGSEPTQTTSALPLYRHPADKNAVATELSAGRMIDVQG